MRRTRRAARASGMIGMSATAAAALFVLAAPSASADLCDDMWRTGIPCVTVPYPDDPPMPDPGWPDPGYPTYPDPPQPDPGGGGPQPEPDPGGHTPAQNQAAADNSRTRAGVRVERAECFTAVTGLPRTQSNWAEAGSRFARIYTAGGAGQTSPEGAMTVWQEAPGNNVLITFYGAFTDLPGLDQERVWTAAYAGISGRTGDAVLAAIEAACFGT